MARLELKAKSETARIAAGRELLDRAYGNARLGIEIEPPPSMDPMKMLLTEIAHSAREKSAWQQERDE